MWRGRTSDIIRPPIARINRIAARLAAEGRDLIDLGQAVLGLPPPVRAVEAIERYLAVKAPHVYSPDPGLPEALEAVADFMRRRKGVTDATARRLMITCGANQAFVNALLTVTRPGDEVIFFAPYYFDHLFAIQLAGCIPVEVPLRARAQRFFVDFDTLEAAIGPRTRCIVVVSPGNPTGHLVAEPDMASLCRLCRDHDLWLLSDETYDLLTFPPARHASPAAMDILEQVCVLGSFSKTFGLAGWRVGYVYGPEEMIEESIKVQDALVVCAPVAGQCAMMGALSEVDAFVGPAVEALTRRRETLWEILESSSLFEPFHPDGATFVFAKIKGEEDSFDFARRLLEETGIISVPGSAFGSHGEGHIRFSYGNQPVARIREAGERLK